MPKCNFNKVAFQLYGNHISAWVLSCKFAAYFQNTILWEQLWIAASAPSKTRFSPFISATGNYFHF